MSIGDWIGIVIIALVILVALFGLSRISRPYGVKTEEEFEQRRREGPGLLSASMMGLQQTLDPGAKKAVEVQQDLRRGIYDDKESPDEPPEIRPAARKRGTSPTNRGSRAGSPRGGGR